MLLASLSIAFIFIILIQLVYWIFLYGKFAFMKEPQVEKKRVPVSIIIAARNEADNLKKFLPKVLEQDYQNFEIIVVNDASTDDTKHIIKDFQLDYPYLKLTQIETSNTYSGNKKNAITKGIEAAQYDHLLFTDADCYPASKDWISHVISHFGEDKKIVLGYGAYEKQPAIINKLIRYETLLTAIQYFSYAKIGNAYMGVGRNLAYKKELFNETNGFEAHAMIKSGDDDLLINELAKKNNTTICISKESFTISTPKKSFNSWFKQKRRHITTATFYEPIHQFSLGLFYASQLLFWLLAILLLTFSLNWQFVILLITIRFIAQYIIISKSSIKLSEQDLILFSPIYDFLLVLIQLGLFVSNLIKKPKHW